MQAWEIVFYKDDCDRYSASEFQLPEFFKVGCWREGLYLPVYRAVSFWWVLKLYVILSNIALKKCRELSVA